MPSNYDSIDLDWTWDGDLVVDQNGDLRDTSYDQVQSLINEIATVIKSSKGDWRDNNSVGANLTEFIGQANTRENANKTVERIKLKLSELCNLKDVKIKAVPIHVNKIAILILIDALPTENNSLNGFEPLKLSFIFDYQEDSIYMTDDFEG